MKAVGGLVEGRAGKSGLTAYRSASPALYCCNWRLDSAVITPDLGEGGGQKIKMYDCEHGEGESPTPSPGSLG